MNTDRLKHKDDAKPAPPRCRSIHKFLICIIALSFLLSCSKEKPADIAKGEPIKAEDSSISGKDAPQAAVRDREILSNIVKVKNAAPELTRIKIMPEIFKQGDVLYVDVIGSDIDGDEVTILYEWTKNGEPAGTEKHIGVPIKRGDKISIKLTPFDGESYGQSVILHREIVNMPPSIIEHRRFNFDGSVFTYQVKAADPDNDTLAYSLRTAPSGMTIGKTTGLIKWDVPADFKGKAEVAIVVSDNHGGEALQSFVFEIKE